MLGPGTPFEHYGAGSRPDWEAPLFKTNPERYRQLFERTFKHPFLGRLIEWASVDWLLPLSNPSPSQKTDLGRGQAPAQFRDVEALEIVDLPALWENLCTAGMRDPLILTAGRMDRRIRLEAGNHRLRLFKKYQIEYVPLVAYVGDHCQVSLKNGKHLGRETHLKLPYLPDIMAPYSIWEYHKPSAIVLEFKPSLDKRI